MSEPNTCRLDLERSTGIKLQSEVCGILISRVSRLHQVPCTVYPVLFYKSTLIKIYFLQM